MKNCFSPNCVHTVTDANINYYTAPFVHPKRRMKEHIFIYVIRGEWSIGQNEKSYDLHDDSLLILFADNTHYGVKPCTAGTKTMYFHVTCEEGDIFDASSDGNAIETYVDASDNEMIKSFFSEVVNCKLSGEQRKADLYFEMLICELSSQKMCLRETEIAKKIKNIIHAYPEKFLSNKEIADMLNVSVKTAETKFKAAFGSTIHQYMLDFKMNEAMNYFDIFGEISVKKVAYNLGFCDEYHFSKQFLKHVGVSPRAYKGRKRPDQKTDE